MADRDEWRTRKTIVVGDWQDDDILSQGIDLQLTV